MYRLFGHGVESRMMHFQHARREIFFIHLILVPHCSKHFRVVLNNSLLVQEMFHCQ